MTKRNYYKVSNITHPLGFCQHNFVSCPPSCRVRYDCALSFRKTESRANCVIRVRCPCIPSFILSRDPNLTESFVELDAYIKQNEFSTIDGGETTGKGTANKGITGKSKAKGEPFAVAGSKKRKDVKGSHGVEQLKKVNTSGISKLSTFFKKA